MIGIAGHVAGVAILDFAGSVREAVPDRFALAVFVPRAFDLIGGGGRAPEEILGERDLGRSIKLRGAGIGEAAEFAVRAAFDDTVQPENKPAGSAAQCRRRGPTAQIRGGSGAK